VLTARHLHGVCNIFIPYKLRLFVWLVIYQGIPSKAKLTNTSLSDGLCPVCQRLETVRHIFGECRFAMHCWSWLEDHHLMLLQATVHWQTMLSGDGCTLVHDVFSRLWHCPRIVVLFVLWKLGCKFVFKHEVSSLSAFNSMCNDEIHHQLLEKETLDRTECYVLMLVKLMHMCLFRFYH
jgi:hypothetical protein